jgi:hypothetical protein
VDDRIEAIARQLHQLMGRGYCTLGKHLKGSQYLCWDHARSILAALDGLGPREYPGDPVVPTLAAREEAREKRNARAATNKRLAEQAKR